MTKEDVYRHLSKEYGWTPQQIATMSPHQQLIYLKGDRYVVAQSIDEARNLLREWNA